MLAQSNRLCARNFRGFPQPTWQGDPVGHGDDSQPYRKEKAAEGVKALLRREGSVEVDEERRAQDGRRGVNALVAVHYPNRPATQHCTENEARQNMRGPALKLVPL